MVFLIGADSVIDNSRQLTNIALVDSGTTASFRYAIETFNDSADKPITWREVLALNV